MKLWLRGSRKGLESHKTNRNICIYQEEGRHWEAEWEILVHELSPLQVSAWSSWWQPLGWLSPWPGAQHSILCIYRLCASWPLCTFPFLQKRKKLPLTICIISWVTGFAVAVVLRYSLDFFFRRNPINQVGFQCFLGCTPVWSGYSEQNGGHKRNSCRFVLCNAEKRINFPIPDAEVRELRTEVCSKNGMCWNKRS